MWCSASWETIGGHLTSTTNLCSWSNLGNTSSTSFENRWMNWMMDATCCVFLHLHPFCFRMSFLWPKYPKFGWGMSRWHRGGSNKRPQVQDKNDYTTHDLGMLLTCRFSWWLASNLPRFVRLVRTANGRHTQNQSKSSRCSRAAVQMRPRNCDRRVFQPHFVSWKKQKGWWVGVLKILFKQYLAAPGDETPKLFLVHHMFLSCDCQKAQCPKSSTEFLRNRFRNPGTTSKSHTDFDSMCHTNQHI